MLPVAMNKNIPHNHGELLLPVGDLSMCIAAIHNGADAVYIGMPGFNARGRTHDHGLDELREMVEMCHLYGVHVHLAFNVLIFENELQKAQELLKEVLPLGIDAFIVQDLGLVKLIKEMAPEQVVHASTQMTITNELAMKSLDDLEMSRFVLGREVSIPEIEKIRERTDKELEVFVHGALCVAYSGQCFTSESIGGRSANRGQCAQSCRLDYDLIVDGKKLTTLEEKYLVSPKDLYGLEHIAKLQEIGVESYKVEGRLKGPQYVSSVGRLYKSEMLKNKSFAQGLTKGDLERVFSRGFFSGWLDGVEHQQLVGGNYSNHRGQEIGEVIDSDERSLLISSKESLANGMGLFFVNQVGNEAGKGSFIFNVETKKDGLLKVSLGRDFPYGKIEVGSTVYLNKDPQLEKKLGQTYLNPELQKHIPLDIEISAFVGKPISISVRTLGSDSVSTSLESDYLVEESQKKATTSEDIQSVLGALSRSAFIVDSWNISIGDNIFIPQKFLKDLKRNLLEQLNAKRIERNVEIKNIELSQLKKTPELNKDTASKISLLIRSQKQLEDFLSSSDKELLQSMLSQIILDYEFGKDYRAGVEMIRSYGVKVYIATTRILKPGEYHNLKTIKRISPDGVLIRNLGALEFFKEEAPEIKRIGDFCLNITNSITFNYLIEKGFDSLALGLDMNMWQVGDLLENVDPSKVETFTHYHMPEFHMEHCVFAAFLSEGSSFRDCGKPCESHKVSMVDSYGENHYLTADSECRNTMFKSTPISTVELLQAWKQKGVGQFRYEALWDDGKELYQKVKTYWSVLAGDLDQNEAVKVLKSISKQGITLGQLDRKDVYQDRKQK